MVLKDRNEPNPSTEKWSRNLMLQRTLKIKISKEH